MNIRIHDSGYEIRRGDNKSVVLQDGSYRYCTYQCGSEVAEVYPSGYTITIRNDSNRIDRELRSDGSVIFYKYDEHGNCIGSWNSSSWTCGYANMYSHRRMSDGEVHSERVSNTSYNDYWKWLAAVETMRNQPVKEYVKPERKYPLWSDLISDDWTGARGFFRAVPRPDPIPIICDSSITYCDEVIRHEWVEYPTAPPPSRTPNPNPASAPREPDAYEQAVLAYQALMGEPTREVRNQLRRSIL